MKLTIAYGVVLKRIIYTFEFKPTLKRALFPYFSFKHFYFLHKTKEKHDCFEEILSKHYFKTLFSRGDLVQGLQIEKETDLQFILSPKVWKDDE